MVIRLLRVIRVFRIVSIVWCIKNLDVFENIFVL
jgi:hypothetical protein